MGFSIRELAPAQKKIESAVPITLTTELLEVLPAQERAVFDSGKIEDFLIAALKEGLTISEIEARARTSPLQDEIVSVQERTILPEIQST